MIKRQGRISSSFRILETPSGKLNQSEFLIMACASQASLYFQKKEVMEDTK